MQALRGRDGRIDERNKERERERGMMREAF